MLQKILFSILVFTGLLLAACVPVMNPDLPPNTLSGDQTQLPSSTALLPTKSQPPVALPTMTEPAVITIATPTPVEQILPPTAGLLTSTYTDDRSTPASLIVSFYNAINRKEFLRAFSYWQIPDTSLGTLESFSNGYADVEMTGLLFGQITGDAGAGQYYYTVPAIIRGTISGGKKNNLVACYVIHRSQPGFQAVPPFAGYSIVRGKTYPLDDKVSDAKNLSSACGDADYPITLPVDILKADLADISKDNFLDNRSGPVEVISSLLNALNRKEYVRAYSYWQKPETRLGTIDRYSAGFSDTDVVTASFGTPSSDIGAGQMYYKVPTAMRVQTISGRIQHFIGCYSLHLSQPGFQAILPFEPLGIIAGKFKEVDGQIDMVSLMGTACE